MIYFFWSANPLIHQIYPDFQAQNLFVDLFVGNLSDVQGEAHPKLLVAESFRPWKLKMHGKVMTWQDFFFASNMFLQVTGRGGASPAENPKIAIYYLVVSTRLKHIL